ncbi:MAG: hypothetical protein AAF664_13855 [Planctomycetota bacterium]
MNQPEERSSSDPSLNPSESETSQGNESPFKPLPSLRTRGLQDQVALDSVERPALQDNGINLTTSDDKDGSPERPPGCPFTPGRYRPSPAAEAREKERQGRLRKQRIEQAQTQAEIGPTGYLTSGCMLASWWMLPFAWLALIAFAWGTQMISVVGIFLAASGLSGDRRRWAMAALAGHLGAIAFSVYGLK